MHLVLIRHAHSEANAKGILSGRLPNVKLSEKGVEQSLRLAKRLGSFPVKQLRVSPMGRCQETITPWLKTMNASLKDSLIIDENLNEVDYGSWSGKKLAALSAHKLWKTVQNNPSAMYFPAGEGLAHMQQRAMSSVHASVSARGKGAAVVVSHGDVIKAIVASALGMHLDDFQRIVIDPASVTILDYSSSNARIIMLNDTRTELNEILKAPHRRKNLLGGGSGK